MRILRDFVREVYPCEAIEREISKARRMTRELYLYLLEHPPPTWTRSARQILWNGARLISSPV